LSPQWRGNVNAVGGEFGTPLAAAVAFGHHEATRALLDAGAMVDVKNVGRYSSAFHSVGRRMDGFDLIEKQRRCKALVALLECYAADHLTMMLICLIWRIDGYRRRMVGLFSRKGSCNDTCYH
jgi:hypothetical protein